MSAVERSELRVRLFNGRLVDITAKGPVVARLCRAVSVSLVVVVLSFSFLVVWLAWSHETVVMEAVRLVHLGWSRLF